MRFRDVTVRDFSLQDMDLATNYRSVSASNSSNAGGLAHGAHLYVLRQCSEGDCRMQARLSYRFRNLPGSVFRTGIENPDTFKLLENQDQD